MHIQDNQCRSLFGHHIVDELPRQAWQKVLTEGKSAFDAEHMCKAGKNQVELLQELEGHLEKNSTDERLCELPHHMVDPRANLGGLLAELRQGDAAAQEIGEALEQALSKVTAFIDPYVESMCGSIEDYISNLWADEDTSLQRPEPMDLASCWVMTLKAMSF